MSSEGGLAEQRLAGVTTLRVHPQGRDPLRLFVFEPHRLALPCWKLALGPDGPPATLITFDRHLDLVPPTCPLPARSASLRTFDELARYELDVRNVDHVLAAAGAGLLGDIVAIARTAIPGIPDGEWIDPRGGKHRIAVARTLEALLSQAGAIPIHGPLVLDFDLDCFTSLSDADPMEVLAWPEEVIERFLLPEGSHTFWSSLWPRVVAVTLACESVHCGGLVTGHRLFESFGRVFFGKVLEVDLP